LRCLVRRVSSASVRVDEKVIGEIGNGLLVYLGVETGDQVDDSIWLLKKLIGMRIFEDSQGKMNESLGLGDGIMLISQFTLFGNMRKGSRPSFNRASEPVAARRLFEDFLSLLRLEFKGTVAVGAFGEHMAIEAVDDGPVSLWLDSRQRGY
jgi:D-aminoacyl-tRNA deacylase